MLILFDIDATLIATSGVGVAALEDSGRELYGGAFSLQQVEFAGRLDPLIIHDLLVSNGVNPTPEAAAAVRRGYVRHLRKRLTDWPERRALPGVPALVEHFAAAPGITIGLLTGNFEESGRMKLQACGLDAERFPIRVRGDESPHTPPARDHLPPIAMERFHARHGERCEPERVTIIGDTPHDVRCARAHGCRALGVATGRFSVEDLVGAGADRAVPDLSDTEDMVRWLTNPMH